jgi:3-isopropylmalate dehydrogenase
MSTDQSPTRPGDRPLELAVVIGDAYGAAEAVDAALTTLAAAGVEVLRRDVELGADRYLRDGQLLPEDALATIRSADALLSGSPPVGARPGIAPGVLDRGIVFGLRRALGLAVNVRTFVATDGRPGDVAVVRENSEGLYFAEGSIVHAGEPTAIATETAVTSYGAVLRCVRLGFELAASRRGLLTIAHKTHVLTASGRMWTEALHAVATEFPQVTVQIENIDTCCLRIVQDPARYDVIVTDNVFGDIVSDVACAALDAFEHSASAEYGAGTSLFEPIHGPQDGVGTPHPVSIVAAVRAAALLARHTGRDKIADRLDGAALAAVGEADPLPAILERLATS